MKHIHILGICGTFMGSMAVLAQQLGYRVSGCDEHVYPPMSDLLQSNGIEIIQGYDPKQLIPRIDFAPDLIVIGNAMSRGNPCVEYVLNHQLNYTSGPQWLQQILLKDKWVLAVSGTHGKTTTASMLTWILEYNGYQPGFLVGGVLGNFNCSSRLSHASDFFVIEADEYDSAFFDKRSKFIHYHPKTLIINNLEFDHADIFENLEAIQKQFHHLVRTVPQIGQIIVPAQVPAIDQVLDLGCWSDLVRTDPNNGWHYRKAEIAGHLINDGSYFDICFTDPLTSETKLEGVIQWDLIGNHNMNNALMAILGARHVGISIKDSCQALCSFINSKRRLEVKGEVNKITVYDDFAHHPTAIKLTLQGLRDKVGTQRILAVLEPRSATMKLGIHQHSLAHSLQIADIVFLLQPEGLHWSLDDVATQLNDQFNTPSYCNSDFEILVAAIIENAKEEDHILIMSNGGFGGIHQKLLDGLQQKFNVRKLKSEQ